MLGKFTIRRCARLEVLMEYPMTVRAMKLSTRTIGMIAALGLAGLSLAGCVYYPSGYGYGYAPGYYAPAPVYGAVVVGGGWGHWHH
jgi:hypothetical protein